MKMNNNSFLKILKSFKYAYKGIIYCIKNEINMRIHLVITTFVILLSSFYNLSKTELILLILTILSVLTLEIVNTAIETVVNLVSPKYNKLAGIAKDVSAGAVLVAAIFSVFVGYNLFWDIKIFKSIYYYFLEHFISLIGIIILIIISFIFVFKLFKNHNTNQRK